MRGNSKWELEAYCFGKRKATPVSFFFANDLVLFREATVENTRVMKDILDQFCLFSRNSMNSNKSMVNFSVNTEVVINNAIGNVLKFQNIEDLGTYLGVSLFHSRTTKNTFQFIVDKI